MIVRKILQQLKAAGLIEVARGTGGVTILRMRDLSLQFPESFLFVIINVKLLKEVVIKKVTKKADMVQSYNCW